MRKMKRRIQLLPWVYHATEEDFESLDFMKEIGEDPIPGVYVIWHGEKEKRNIIHVAEDKDVRTALSAHQSNPEVLKHKENAPIHVARALLATEENRDKAVKYLRYLYFNEPVEDKKYCVNSPI